MHARRFRWLVPVVLALACLCRSAMAGEDYGDAGLLAIESAPDTPIATYRFDQLKGDFALQIVETHTPWTLEAATTRFRGPYLKDVLAKFGLDKQAAIEAYAYDDYKAPIPMQEIDTYNPVLALEAGCTAEDRKTSLCTADQAFRPLRMEDRGPFYIVWPLDRLPADYRPLNTQRWVFFVVALRPAPAQP